MNALVYMHVPVHVEVEHTLVGYTATMHWGVEGGRNVSESRVSQLRSHDVFEPLSSSDY